MAKDGLERACGCKHPWRVAFLRVGPEPNKPQVAILATLIRMRGKKPSSYGLDDNSLLVGAEIGKYETVITSLAAEIVRYLQRGNIGSVEDLLELTDSGESKDVDLQALLSTLFNNELDVPPEVFDEALVRAIETYENN